MTNSTTRNKDLLKPLDRLGFLGWYLLLSFGYSIFTVSDPEGVVVYTLLLLIGVVWISLRRLKAVGWHLWYCLFLLVPYVGILLFIPLFVWPNAEKEEEKTATQL